MTDTTYIRSSVLPSWNDCARRACANGIDVSDPADEDGSTHRESPFRRSLIDAGYNLKPLRPTVAPAIGTAVHKGAEIFLKSTVGGVDAAIQSFRASIANGVEYDACSPNSVAAEKQIISIYGVYGAQVAPHIEPARLPAGGVAVEVELRAAAGPGFELIGHPDVITANAEDHDLKTGQKHWPAIAQLGSHLLLGEANKIPVEKLLIDYIPRVPVGKPQPPAEVITYDPVVARAYAIQTIRQIKAVVTEFRNSMESKEFFRIGNPNVIPANPMSQLCSNKYCSARGTEFCKVWMR